MKGSTANFLVARTVVDLRSSVLPVRVLNPTDRYQCIKAGTCVATCDPIVSVQEVGAVESPTEQSSQENGDAPVDVPEHLKDLFERSTTCLSTKQKQELNCLLVEFEDVFAKDRTDLERTSLSSHKIDTGSTLPIRQAPRRLPLFRREEARVAVQEMRKQGVIEPSTSPWASPIVLVRKKDGSTRFCVDYRKLNAVTKKDSYPLPRTDTTLDAFGGSVWFSTLDLQSGYWQVEMNADDKEKTVFTTGDSLWQFTVMPFGLCNAPATFERLMDQVLAGLPWEVCLVYLDDIIVHASEFEGAISRLREVFLRLRTANLKLNPKKCQLFAQEVRYLGHIISKHGLATDPEKVKAVQEWPVPRTQRVVRSFLGL